LFFHNPFLTTLSSSQVAADLRLFWAAQTTEHLFSVLRIGSFAVMSTNIEEKAKDADVRHTGSSSSSDNAPPGGFLPATAGVANVDAAWKFLNEHRDVQGVDEVNLSALRHKIDWHIVPLMFLCYTMQFLDKVILNVSRNSASSCSR
jgi:hypothetical protein